MLIVDDLVLAPFKGLLWVFRKIHDAAKAEIEGRRQRITAELSELYMQLDTGRITEQEFDSREQALLEELDRLDKQLQRLPEEEREEGEPGGEAAPEEESGGGAKAP